MKGSMERLLSSVTPRFLTEEDREIVLPPRVIELIEIGKSLFFVPTKMASVFSGLRRSLLCVIQFCISEKLLEVVRIMECTFSGLSLLCNCVSSA